MGGTLGPYPGRHLRSQLLAIALEDNPTEFIGVKQDLVARGFHHLEPPEIRDGSLGTRLFPLGIRLIKHPPGFAGEIRHPGDPSYDPVLSHLEIRELEIGLPRGQGFDQGKPFSQREFSGLVSALGAGGWGIGDR